MITSDDERVNLKDNDNNHYTTCRIESMNIEW